MVNGLKNILIGFFVQLNLVYPRYLIEECRQLGKAFMHASNGSSGLGAGLPPEIRVRLCSVPKLMALHTGPGALGSDMLLIGGSHAIGLVQRHTVHPGMHSQQADWCSVMLQ